MCGIAGMVSPLDGPETRGAMVRAMCQGMLHRGPDDAGCESYGDATLGMQRLAIFDPANGHQPMATPDGRFHLIFNGAIYNFRALRQELSAAGHTFRTECDTEVLLAAYAEWGERCLGRLRGMYAFAVWDAREQSLFLARDPFGIKPLYYRQDGKRLVFASEINAMIGAGAFTAEIDPLSVADYLAWFAVPAPRTIYRGVFSLRPGECATFQAGRLDIRSAWNFRSIPKPALCTSRAQFVRELRGRLEDTIQAHLLADVPVGAFLSGGLDSAVVVALMSRASSTRLKTFSIGFNEADFSEAGVAAETAQHLGTEHHPSVLTGAQVAADVETLLATLDQPTGDGINTYYASAAARRGGVTVALSGLGGDELFGGYPSFRTTPNLAHLLPVWHTLPEFAQRSLIARLRRGNTRTRKLADVLQYANDIHEIGSLQRRVFSEPRRRALLAPAAAKLLEGRTPLHPELLTLAADLEDAKPFEMVSAWELRTYMSDVLLRDSDVMSMRHSLELRVPFVDRPFIEWLWHQPSSFKEDRRQPKSALAEAVSDLLPPGLMSRKKRGFTLPFPLWMRKELRPFLDHTFSDASVDHSGFFARRHVQEYWRGFHEKNDNRMWSRVWSLAVLIAFTNRRVPMAATRRDAAPTLTSRPPMPEVTLHTPIPVRPVKHRTLLLAPEIFASEGGIPRILQIYLKALCDLAVPSDKVRLMALNDGMVDSRDLRRCANEQLEDWRVCSRDKTKFIRAAVAMSRGCDRLVCGHVAQLPVAWAAMVLNPKMKYYLVAHGLEVWRAFTLPERLALRGAEKIFCVSDFTRRELLRNCPLPEGKAVVLHNALDPYFDIKPGEPFQGGPRVILTIARLSHDDRYKGVESLIEAMPAIVAEQPDAILRVIGRGDDAPRLHALRDKLGLRTKIEFLGYVDDRRMTKELRGCQLFALPSKKEGFGLVFLEAMANGRPCLGARAGGIPEVITDSTGVLVEYGNVAEIASAAVNALRGDWDEQAMLSRARDFSYSVFKDRLASLLD